MRSILTPFKFQYTFSHRFLQQDNQRPLIPTHRVQPSPPPSIRNQNVQMMLRLVPKFLVHRKNILDGKAFTVYKYSMPAIRHYSYNGCAATLGAIPGGTAFLKIKSKPAPGRPQAISAVDWLGFICKAGARRLPFARPGKLVASYVTNGDYLAHEWKPLRSD